MSMTAARWRRVLGHVDSVTIPAIFVAMFAGLYALISGDLRWLTALLLIPAGLAAGSLIHRQWRLAQFVEDLDLYVLDPDLVRKTANRMFSEHAVSTHCPSDFERAARLWLARGVVDLPPWSRPTEGGGEWK